MHLDVVIPAAGVGSRMHSDIPKQYLSIFGKEVITRTIEAFLDLECVKNIIVVIGQNDVTFKTLPISKHHKIKIAIGGLERVDSVLSGLKQSTCNYVMVHDAARPLVVHDDILNLIDTCTKNNCVGGILACAVADTLKSEKDGCIVSTVDRSHMYRAQTPQLFDTKLLIEAIEKALSKNALITDEASAMELCGYAVKIVEGKSTNFKLTTPDDFDLAKALIAFKEVK